MTYEQTSDTLATGYAVVTGFGKAMQVHHVATFSDYTSWENANESCGEYRYEFVPNGRIVPVRESEPVTRRRVRNTERVP